MKKEILKTIISPGTAIAIGLSTMVAGTIDTAINENNIHKTEQSSTSKGEHKEVSKEILIFDRNSLIARHKPEVNLKKPISRSYYTLWAGGGFLGTGILWYLSQPTKAGRKTNSE